MFVFFRLDTWYDIVYGHGYHYTHSNGEAGLGGHCYSCLGIRFEATLGLFWFFSNFRSVSQSQRYNRSSDASFSTRPFPRPLSPRDAEPTPSALIWGWMAWHSRPWRSPDRHMSYSNLITAWYRPEPHPSTPTSGAPRDRTPFGIASRHNHRPSTNEAGPRNSALPTPLMREDMRVGPGVTRRAPLQRA